MDRELFVKVSFPGSYSEYDYICEDYSVEVGDWVRVPTPKGEKLALVKSFFFEDMSNMPLPSYRYKRVSLVIKDTGGSGAGYSTVAPSREVRCVSVIFELDGNEYSYTCEDESIVVEDFVIVVARGQEKVAKVVEVSEETSPNWKPVVRKADSWEIESARDRFDIEYQFQEIDRECEKERARQEEREALEALEAERSSKILDPYFESFLSSMLDGIAFSSGSSDSLLDEHGFVRNGKAEAYEEQLRKAAKAGRLTDDRGFVLNPHYAERLRDNFAYDHLYFTGEEEDEPEDEYED